MVTVDGSALVKILTADFRLTPADRRRLLRPPSLIHWLLEKLIFWPGLDRLKAPCLVAAENKFDTVITIPTLIKEKIKIAIRTSISVNRRLTFQLFSEFFFTIKLLTQ